MYERLLRQPYFQGMSKDNITAILDKVKLEFKRFKTGEVIARQSSPCNDITMLINGTVVASRTPQNGCYTFFEEIEAPFAFEPNSLFGLKACYKNTYHAKEECDILVINKSYIFTEFARHEIFLMNILNLTSQRTQQKEKHIWKDRSMNIPEKIADFFASRSELPDGRKALKTKMEDMAAILGETRINISRALNELQTRGAVELKRKEIIVPSLKKLIAEAENIGTEKPAKQPTEQI
ncbi:MAG: Crp/Fnr family transcriptional regulator [Bacteroidaceae bacterium]|nr:Crp/Fnr family transcriptional regulator [Bacteroidaceae bacterium]